MLTFFTDNPTSTAFYNGTDLSKFSGSEIIALAKSQDSSYQKGMAQFLLRPNPDVKLWAKFSQESTIDERRLDNMGFTSTHSFSCNAFLNACNTDGINNRSVYGPSYNEENLAKLENRAQGLKSPS